MSQILIADGIVVELDGVSTLEPLPDMWDGSFIISRPRCQRGTIRSHADLAVLDDQLTGLEHISRQLEHQLTVRIRGINCNVRIGTNSKMTLVAKSQNPCWSRPCDYGNFVQGVLSVKVVEHASFANLRR